MNFNTSINRILGHEGGYVNDPKDPGGETNWGISKRSYPHLNIKSLTRERAIEIYYVDFYLPILMYEQSEAVAYQLLDFAVNSGAGNAVRAYQRALGVAPDGRFGPISRAAVKKTSECDKLMLILAERLSFMTSLKNWPAHGRGWARRIAGNLRYAAMDNTD